MVLFMHNNYLHFKYILKNFFSFSDYVDLEKKTVPFFCDLIDDNLFGNINSFNSLNDFNFKIFNDNHYHVTGSFNFYDDAYFISFTQSFFIPFFLNYQKKLVKNKFFSAFLIKNDLLVFKNNNILFINDHVFNNKQTETVRFIQDWTSFLLKNKSENQVSSS